MTATTPRRVRAALTAALCAVLLTGCGNTPSPSGPEDLVRLHDTLAARLSLEQTIARYQEMITRIRKQLDTELGPFPWEQFEPPSRDTCGSDFPNSGGATAYLGLWGFTGSIPDDKWPRARQIALDITAEYGFVPHPEGVSIERPGYHELTGFDTTLGASYGFGTKVNTTIDVSTGCHLPDTPS